MKTPYLLLCAAFAALNVSAKTSTPEGWLDDYDAALKKAAEENKHVVVDFSGSDWCGWCQRLDREVFATDVFRKGAADKYVLLMIDSPSDQSLLTPEAAKRNPELVKKFNVHGFPTVVVLDPKGEVVLRTGYKKGGPEKYLRMLDEEIRLGPDIKKYIKPIEDVLNRYDDELQRESDAVLEKAKEKFPAPAKDASKSEKRKHMRKVQDYARKVMFEEVFAKYIPLLEKTFEEAKGMKVPETLAERKKDLIGEQEERFNQLKQAVKEFQADKKSKDKE